MNKFVELLGNIGSISVGMQQKYAIQQLPNLIRESNLAWCKDGKYESFCGRFMAIGVAPYSREDLELLDFVNYTLSINPVDQICVCVFSVLDCCNYCYFDNFILELGKFYQTPLVGLWENRKLISKEWGKQARELVRQEIGIGKNVCIEINK
jgi:hypothetical protein